MEASTIWWIIAGLTIAAELLTGTIYLLMLAIGMAAGAICAHMGWSWSTQIIVAAIISSLCVLICRQLRRRKGPQLPPSANADLNLDIGEVLHVPQWNSDGTARIPYRGSHWTVVSRESPLGAPGLYRVVEVQGNRLIVAKA